MTVAPACGGVNSSEEVDAGGADAGNADAAPSPLPNIAEVLGRPWSASAPFTVSSEWQAACAAELPNAASEAAPPMPASAENCAGNPAACGSAGTQDCRQEPAASDWLHRATVDTSAHPTAVCNDGSPAVVEVRRGRGAGANHWLIWFRAGGGCVDQHSCAKRWCGNQSGATFRATHMSNDWNGDGVIDQPHCAQAEAGSALDPTLAGNPFAEANVVHIRYCASDSHSGDAGAVPLLDEADDDPDDRPFSVHFRGHAIAATVVQMLKEGVVSDDGTVTLPSIDDATQVVISGSSAGAGGALHNMDYVHEQLRATNPGVTVRGVVDANLRPSFEVLQRYGVYVDANRDEMATAGTDWASFRRQAVTDFWSARSTMNMFVDETCADHYGRDPDLMHNCLELSALLVGTASGTPFIETPIFVRRDLADPTTNYLDCVDPVTEEPCYDPGHSMLAYEQQAPSRWLTVMDATDHVGETLDEVFAAPSVTGVFAPRCGTHIGLVNSNFSVQRVTHYDDELGVFTGSSRSFMEALAYWLATGDAVEVIDASVEEGSPSSVCSAP